MTAARALQALIHVDPKADDVTEEERILATVGGMLAFEALYQLRRIAGGEALTIKIVR